MKDILAGQIQALVPSYTERGANSTLIKRLEGDILIGKSTRRVLGDLCRFYHYDLKASNKEYGLMLGIKKTPPIPFTDRLILIAVKTRQPIGKDDGASSYINIEEVEGVKNGTIYFRDGKELQVLASDKTVEKNIKLAKLLKGKTRREPVLVREEGSSYNNSLADRLSLMEDLAIIYRKLQAIEKILRD